MCDADSSDPDTGWGGFTDHRVNKHFYSHKEQRDYYKNYHIEKVDSGDDSNPYHST